MSRILLAHAESFGLRRRSFASIAALAAYAAISITASEAQDRPGLAFTDVSTTHLPQAPDLHALDAAAIDVDKDGDLDLAIAVEYGVNRLYVNDGSGRFTFKQGAFGDVMHDSEHVRAADFDRDGNMDLVFVAESDEVHQLFLGDGKGGFRDASDRLPGRSQGNAVAVGDLNGDSLPDIVVGNTGEAPVVIGKDGRAQHNDAGERRARNFLWLNDAKRPGYFIDATATNLPDTDDQSEGLDLADMDGDGDLDILTASATKTNRLLLNDGEGRFRDGSDRLQLKVPMETRQVHAFDANADGKLDILYSNLTSNNRGWDKDPQTRLLMNDGSGRYLDETAARLPAHRFSSWASTIMDFNYDGAPDIVVSAIEVPGFVPLQMRAWQNDGKGRFADVTLAVIPGLTVGRSWDITQGDFDGDKKLDLFVGAWGTQARLLLTDEQKIRASRPPFKLLRPAPQH